MTVADGQAAFWPAPDQTAPPSDSWVDSKGRTNPLLRLFGRGPEGAICGDCVHIVGYEYARTYWKCTVRSPREQDRRGASTDQKLRWPACGKYAEEQESL